MIQHCLSPFYHLCPELFVSHHHHPNGEPPPGMEAWVMPCSCPFGGNSLCLCEGGIGSQEGVSRTLLSALERQLKPKRCFVRVRKMPPSLPQTDAALQVDHRSLHPSGPPGGLHSVEDARRWWTLLCSGQSPAPGSLSPDRKLLAGAITASSLLFSGAECCCPRLPCQSESWLSV